MDVLHHAFSLSACPKCHLLVCKHTSLANLDFQTIEDEASSSSSSSSSSTCKTNSTHPHQRLSTHGMNLYLLPSTTVNNRYSWTTFGSHSSSSSTDTLKQNDDDENIPFADEHIISFDLPKKPIRTHLVRTQSERYPKHVTSEFYLTKSFSYSTINTFTPKLLKFSSIISPHIEHEDHGMKKCSCNLSLISFILLVICYLLTNAFDLVLLYVYYHINSVTLIIFTCALLTCDFVLWMNHLIEYRTIPTRLLLIPFTLRFYLLYALIESLVDLFNPTSMINSEILDASSSSSSTTTTLETNLSRTTKIPLIPSSSHRTSKRYFYDRLILFSLTHSSLVAFVNLYLWSSNFQWNVKSSLTMDFFLPRWMIVEHRLTFQFSYHSTFILMTMFYHLIFLSIILRFPLRSGSTVISIFAQLCLIITRLYTLIFLLHLHAWWFTLTFIIIHYTFMITLLVDRSIVDSDRNGISLKFILSLLTFTSVENTSVHALISLENISIFLHHLYLETFALPTNTTLHLIIFISILISLQIIGFLLAMLSRNFYLRLEKNKTSMVKL